jgi:hypothetical protein
MTTAEQRETPPARRGGARRAELVALASRLFRERGYHGVGMRTLAEARRHAGRLALPPLPQQGGAAPRGDLRRRPRPDRRPAPDPRRPRHAPRAARPARAGARPPHRRQPRDAWWVASRELRALSPDRFDEVQVYRRRYQHRIAQHLADGVRAGEFDCDDPRLVSLAILDMINGLNEWFDPVGRLTIDEIADRYAVLAVRQLGP